MLRSRLVIGIMRRCKLLSGIRLDACEYVGASWQQTGHHKRPLSGIIDCGSVDLHTITAESRQVAVDSAGLASRLLGQLYLKPSHDCQWYQQVGQCEDPKLLQIFVGSCNFSQYLVKNSSNHALGVCPSSIYIPSSSLYRG